MRSAASASSAQPTSKDTPQHILTEPAELAANMTTSTGRERQEWRWRAATKDEQQPTVESTVRVEEHRVAAAAQTPEAGEKPSSTTERGNSPRTIDSPLVAKPPSSCVVAVRIKSHDLPVIFNLNSDALERPLKETIILPFLRVRNADPDVSRPLSMSDLNKVFIGEVEGEMYDMETRKALKLAGYLRANKVERAEVTLQFRATAPREPPKQKPPMLYTDLQGREAGIKPADYDSLIERLQDSRSHDKLRIHLLQNALVNRRVTCEQARGFIREVDFDQNKAAVAAMMWRSIADPDNFERVVLSQLEANSKDAVLKVLGTSRFGN